MSQTPTPRLRTASLSDVGRVRSANQDEVSEFEGAGGARLLVVADGMGGHAGGEVASATSVAAIGEYFGSAGQEEPQTLLRNALEAANERVFRQGNDDPALFGMGTTAVAVLIDGHGATWVAHVGDSRAYRLHQGQLECLTEDHSWVQEQVRMARLTPEEAEVHPRRNALMRSIGVDRDVEVDVRPVEVAAGDWLLLCSDGLWGELDDGTIAAVLAEGDPEMAVHRLVDLANEAGGHDNVTVAVAVIPEGPAAAAPRSRGPAEPAEKSRSSRLALTVAGVLVAALALWRVCA